MATSQGSITVSPGIPLYAEARACQLGLVRNIYFSVLLNNYLHGPPMALPVVDTPAKVVKVRIQLTMPRALRAAAARAAARWNMSLSELVESLVIKDADSESDTLPIWPARGSKRPVLRLRKTRPRPPL